MSTPLGVVDREPWQTAAACQGHAVLFDRASWPHDRVAHSEAAVLCAACPVRAQCAGFADRYREQGFWAGRLRGPEAARADARLTVERDRRKAERDLFVHVERALRLGHRADRICADLHKDLPSLVLAYRRAGRVFPPALRSRTVTR